MTAGDLLFREGDAPALYVLLAGEVSLEPMAGGEPSPPAPATTIGVYETLERRRDHRLARPRDDVRHRAPHRSRGSSSTC